MASFDFDHVFGDHYLYFPEDMLTGERSDMEVEVIVRLLGLQPGMRVLDIPCGHGRIANRLAQRGCEVIGVDCSASFLEVARRAGSPVDYRLADMRHRLLAVIAATALGQALTLTEPGDDMLIDA